MATAPTFAANVNHGAVLIGAAETDLQAPVNSSVVFTAGVNGSKVEEIVAQASKTGTLAATTVAGLVYLFLYDGTTYHLFDTITVTAVTASATVAPFRAKNTDLNLFLKSGWSIRASQSIAGNANMLQCFAQAGDF